MKNITQKELGSLNACQSAQDWGDACDAIKEARGGMYPEDWWNKVKLSGMMDKIMTRWGEDSSLSVKRFDKKADLFKYMTDGKNRSEEDE